MPRKIIHLEKGQQGRPIDKDMIFMHDEDGVRIIAPSDSRVEIPMICCDCGLSHKIGLRLVNGGESFAFDVDADRCTTEQARKISGNRSVAEALRDHRRELN